MSPAHATTAHDPRLLHLPLPALLPQDNDPADHSEARLTAPAFTITVPGHPPSSAAVTAGPPTGDGTGGPATSTNAASAEPLTEGLVDEPARCLEKPPLVYPLHAEHEGIEADVALEIVIDRVGRVTSARPSTHVGYGLEAAAEQSVRSYRFSPARKAGVPVAVRMKYVISYRLR